MANSPPSTYIYDYLNGDVRILLPSQLLFGTPVGQPLGTGGPALATAEPATVTRRAQNRVLAVGDELLCVGGGQLSATIGGVYRKDQGGVDQWGQELGCVFATAGQIAGLFLLHPGGVPTVVVVFIGSGNAMFTAESTDNGLTWSGPTNRGGNFIASGSGQAITFRDSIYWCAKISGSGGLNSFDFALGTLTTWVITGHFISTAEGNTYGIHVHDNVVFLAGWRLGDNINRIAKLQAGALVTVMNGLNTQIRNSSAGHNCLFSDPVTGDLICIWSGSNFVGNAPRTLFQRIENATTTATPVTDISSTVLGAGQGGDKYLEGAGAADKDRSWYAYVDNVTDPVNPRTFLKTTGLNGVTELWEWKGVGSEIELVNGGAGIDIDQFSLDVLSFGGGHRAVYAARIEIGDSANSDVEVSGGRKFYFRAIGTGGPYNGTFYVNGEEEAPDVQATILAASFTVESGAPATTPVIVGNQLTNITPDDGTVLYSIVLDLAVASLGSGDPGRLMGDLV